MSWLNKLERRLEPLAIPNITLYLVIGQTFVYLCARLQLIDPGKCAFVPALAAHGEPWRILTFLFLPPSYDVFFTAFALYLFYLFGTGLEDYWGKVRYNLFLFVGYLLTVSFAFLTPLTLISNTYLGGAIFLAFAYLNPEFVMYIFFILPVKIKWLGLIQLIYYGYLFLTRPLSVKLSITAAVVTFLLFFGRDLVLGARSSRRRMQSQSRRIAEDKARLQPRHRCHICGKTDLSNPEMDFRYCSKCAGDQCYCPEHIFNHAHVTVDEEAKS